MPSRLKDVALSTRDSFILDPTTVVVPPGFNARNFANPDNLQHVRELADSIKEMGVQNPIIVRWDGEHAVLVDGECRLRASLLAISEGAEVRGIPALAEAKGTSEADRVLSLVLRNGSKPLDALEEGVVYGRLVKLGWIEADIARKVGCSASKVSRALALNGASDEYKALVSSGTVSATLAVEELITHGESQAKRRIQKAAAAAPKTPVKKGEEATPTPVRVKKADLAGPKPKREPSNAKNDAKAMVACLTDIAQNSKDPTSRNAAKTCLESIDLLK